MIFDGGRPEVAAVLDWELSTLGDPLADFAYLAMSWAMPREAGGASLGGIDFAASGIPTLDETVALYCRLTDREGAPDLNWYFAYNLFRLIGIVQGIKKRMLDGNASSSEAGKTVARLPGLVGYAAQFAQAAGMAA